MEGERRGPCASAVIPAASRALVGPTISVIVVSWNARAALADCLAALESQADPDFEAVVVDNGSADGTASWLRQAYPRHRRVELPENVGFAEGCNRGIEAASGEWIATLNDDARPDPGWISALRTAARCAEPRIGMLQPHVLRLARPAETSSTGVVVRSDGCFEDRDAGGPALCPTRTEPFCPSAAAALYRRQMLDEVRLASGVFDRGYFAYFEDVDLGWRCRLAGWEARFVPQAIVHHTEHASAERRELGFLERHCRRNRVRTLAKNASPRLLARALPRLGLDLAAAVRWGPAEGARWLAAALDGLRQRLAVGRLARIPRRAVERRWVAPSATSSAIVALETRSDR